MNHNTLAALHVAFIGYGEVGKIFAREMIAGGAGVSFFDILLADPASGPEMRAHASAIGAVACDCVDDALAGAQVIVSAVTASASLDVAREVARAIQPEQFFVDLNSVSPATKQFSSRLIDAVGGRYVEAAVMASVPPYGIKVPIILGGPHAEQLERCLAQLDMRLEVGVPEVGVASAIKMCRSVMIKGIEALAVECFLTARRYGVENQVIASLDETFPSMHWEAQADHLISRVVQHGRRRAAEMREVARTEQEVGMRPLLASHSALCQDWIADMVSEGTVLKTEKSWRKVADAIEEKYPATDRTQEKIAP